MFWVVMEVRTRLASETAPTLLLFYVFSNFILRMRWRCAVLCLLYYILVQEKRDLHLRLGSHAGWRQLCKHIKTIYLSLRRQQFLAVSALIEQRIFVSFAGKMWGNLNSLYHRRSPVSSTTRGGWIKLFQRTPILARLKYHVGCKFIPKLRKGRAFRAVKVALGLLSV